MSTSPSWFDPEKLSRLVKKPAGKNAPSTGPLPASPRESASLPPVSGALLEVGETDKPQGGEDKPHGLSAKAMMTSQHVGLSAASATTPAHTVGPIRAPIEPDPTKARSSQPIPTLLPRRTAPLPVLKSLFQYEVPPAKAPAPEAEATQAPEDKAPSKETQETAFPSQTFKPEDWGGVPEASEEAVGPQSNPIADDLAAAWEKIAQLNDEIRLANLERERGVAEAAQLREELSRVGETATKAGEGAAQTEEIALLTAERDQARGEYATLREDYENLKQEQVRLRAEAGESRAKLEQEIEQLRQDNEKSTQESAKLRKQIEDKDREIDAMKNAPRTPDADVEALKQEINGLKEQVAQAKEEASVAQRGLALSQKALQETRDALREAQEAASQARINSENSKKECATLVQQNMLLQAQHDQLARELSAAKAKLNRS